MHWSYVFLALTHRNMLMGLFCFVSLWLFHQFMIINIRHLPHIFHFTNTGENHDYSNAYDESLTYMAKLVKYQYHDATKMCIIYAFIIIVICLQTPWASFTNIIYQLLWHGYLITSYDFERGLITTQVPQFKASSTEPLLIIGDGWVITSQFYNNVITYSCPKMNVCSANIC